jgi:DNA-binding transcriptional regulator YhcF (GntR family)
VKISINKDSAVSIRDQIIEQVAIQIASGQLAHREKLPSIRALAKRLGIHYSTVTGAYNHLAEVGLVDIRQGSGARVPELPMASNKLSGTNYVDGLFYEFLAKLADQGYARRDFELCLERAEKRPTIKKILAVDGNADFLPILIAELKPHFKIAVEACTTNDLKNRNYDDALIISSLYNVSHLINLIADRTRLLICNIEPGSTEIEAAAKLPSGKLVLLVSASQTMFQIATKLIASVRGNELAVRSVMPSESSELAYMLRHADLILCDASSQQAVLSINDKAQFSTFRLYSQNTIDLIKERINKWS